MGNIKRRGKKRWEIESKDMKTDELFRNIEKNLAKIVKKERGMNI